MAIGRKTGGRTKGTLNKRNAEKHAEIQASGELPLDYMLRVMRTGPLEREGSAREFAEAALARGGDLIDQIEGAILAYAKQQELCHARRDHMAVSAARFCHATLQATAPVGGPPDDSEEVGNRRQPVSGSIDEIVARFTRKKGKH